MVYRRKEQKEEAKLQAKDRQNIGREEKGEMKEKKRNGEKK